MHKNLLKLGPQVWSIPSFVGETESDSVVRLAESSPDWEKAAAGRYKNNVLVESKVDLEIRDVEVTNSLILESANLSVDYTYLKEVIEDNYSIKFKNFSKYMLSKYQPGCHIKPHSDTGVYSTQRLVTCVLYLNNDYKGGEIYFPTVGLTHRPSTGSLVMFPSELLHGVNPIENGVRYCAVWFAESPSVKSLRL